MRNYRSEISAMRLRRFRIGTVMIATSLAAFPRSACAVGCDALIGKIDLWPLVWVGIVLLTPVVTLMVVAVLGPARGGWLFAWCWGIAVGVALLALVVFWVALDLRETPFYAVPTIAAGAQLGAVSGFCAWLARRFRLPGPPGGSTETASAPTRSSE
jgi:hypothetical protein